MSPQEELAEADGQAIENSQSTGSTFTTSVGGSMGQVGKPKGKGGKLKKFGAAGFITIALIIIAVFFLSGFTFPDAILTRTIEETDMQYADAVQSKELVFQEALYEGKIPDNTAERLKQNGVTVGYLDGDTFIASNVGPVVIAAAETDAMKNTDITLYSSDSGRQSLSLQVGDKVVTWENFYSEVNSDPVLYDAFTKATYGRAAYYYDEKAQEVFKKIGTSRNNFSNSTDLTEVMDGLLDSGNVVGFSDTTWHYHPIAWYVDPDTGSYYPTNFEVRQDEFNCTGTNVSNELKNWAEPGIAGPYDENGNWVGYSWDGTQTDINTGDYGCDGTSASSYLRAVSQSNMSQGDAIQTVKNTADSLKAADTVTEEQRSMILYTGFMESISKMKAGYGFNSNSETDKILAAMATMGSVQYGSNINDVMNRLFEPATTQVVDVKTGETIEVYGSMLESPSMYAILAGEKVDMDAVVNYSNDRILKTIENQVGDVSTDTIKKTAVTVKDSSSSRFGKYTEENVRDYTPSGTRIARREGENYNRGEYQESSLSTIETTVQNSMFDNSFDTIQGIAGGELLAKGAVSLGKELAKASGGAAGDNAATVAYLQLTDTVLAMDAKVDRMNRSPLDITSQNTFLGSIVYKFAVSTATSRGGILGKLSSLGRMTGKSLGALMPSVFADEATGTDSYLGNFGDCQTAKDVLDAVGSAQCVEITTFDTSTYMVNGESIYRSSKFNDVLSDNLKYENGQWSIKPGTEMEAYVNFNEEREVPIGITDGGVIDAYQDWELAGDDEVTKFFKKIGSALTNLFKITSDVDSGNISEDAMNMATGKTFVNSESNDKWTGTYKYIQRYISLSRAAQDMRAYDGDENAYNFKYFGNDDVIARYIREKNERESAIANSN